MRLQPQVKKDFLYILAGVGILTVVMWGVFAALHFTVAPAVPFDWTVLRACRRRKFLLPCPLGAEGRLYGGKGR